MWSSLINVTDASVCVNACVCVCVCALACLCVSCNWTSVVYNRECVSNAHSPLDAVVLMIPCKNTCPAGSTSNTTFVSGVVCAMWSISVIGQLLLCVLVQLNTENRSLHTHMYRSKYWVIARLYDNNKDNIWFRNYYTNSLREETDVSSLKRIAQRVIAHIQRQIQKVIECIMTMKNSRPLTNHCTRTLWGKKQKSSLTRVAQSLSRW